MIRQKVEELQAWKIGNLEVARTLADTKIEEFEASYQLISRALLLALQFSDLTLFITGFRFCL